MFGDLPPSSSVTGTRLRAALAAISRPTSRAAGKADPVYPACLDKPFADAAVACDDIEHAGGKAGLSISRQNSSVVAEACSDGLTTTQFPAARAGASLFDSRPIGEFHAVISTATPSGSRLA